MNKKGGILALIGLIIMLLLVIGGVGFALIQFAFFNINIECYEKIAKDYCEDNDLYFSRVSLNFFECVEDERAVGNDYRFKYTPEEKKSCKLVYTITNQLNNIGGK